MDGLQAVFVVDELEEGLAGVVEYSALFFQFFHGEAVADVGLEVGELACLGEDLQGAALAEAGVVESELVGFKGGEGLVLPGGVVAGHAR